MDDPSINLKFLQKVQNGRVENEQPALIDIGSCGLHTVYGDFKCGAQSTRWKLKGILHGSYQIFHNSPARSDDYQSVTDSAIYPRNFVLCSKFMLDLNNNDN